MPYTQQFLALSTHLEQIVSQGGYAILFIFTFLEGIPVLGMAVPGHISIIIAGFLAKIGTLHLYAVIIISIVGAVLGDFIGFYLGRKYGLSFIDRLRPYFFVTDQHIEKARDLLAKHTGKALVIGRFTPATRALMPFLVGSSEISVGKFWLFNIIGGISWAVSSVLLGYIFGFGYHAIVPYIGRVVVIAAIAIVIIVWGYRFVNTRFHIFRQYELFTLILNLISLTILALMIQDASSAQHFMVNFDTWLSSSIVDPLTKAVLIPASLAQIAYWITTIGGTVVTSTVGGLICLWLLFKKKWRSAAIMFFSLATTAISLGILKEFFLRARPTDSAGLILGIMKPIVNDPSFPSGHAGMAAAFFVVVAYLFSPKIQSWVKRELFLVLCILAVILIGLSRIVLNVHWGSDVIAGWALGIFMATASILFIRYIGALLLPKVISKSHQ